MSTYKLIIKGELLPGEEVAQVRERITKLFKLQEKPSHVDALFSKQPVTVKKGLSLEQAQAYQGVIEKAGMGCELVAEGTLAPATAPTQEQQPLAMESQARAEVMTEVEEARAAATPAIPQAPESKTAEPPTTETEAPRQPLPEPHASPDADYNPYQQPQADLYVAPQGGELTLMGPQKLGMGAGWSWFSEGFGYFKQQPLVWLGTVVVFFVVMFIIGMIPVLNLFLNLLMPVITGGFMVMCYTLYRGEATGVGEMFAGFKTHFGGLLLVGVLYFVGILIVGVAGFALMFVSAGGLGLFGAMAQGGSEINSIMGAGMILAMLVVFGLMVPVVMAFWFAPALVVMHDMPALQAMVLSFKGCLRNILPFLIYGLLGFVLVIVATLPLMLGWLVLLPVMWGSMFAGYRQIFTESAAPGE